MQHEFSHALSAAKFFRRIGLVPLPSRMDRKQPTLNEYKQYQTERVPDFIYSPDEWRTTNLQLQTGAIASGATKVIVVDLDGELAIDAWKRLCKRHAYTPSGIWISQTGSGGRHLYYRLPPEMKRCPTRLLWGLYDPIGGPQSEGGWVKHTEVKLLGDGMLAVAPPSRHVKTGKEYQWLGKWSPAVFALPAEAPQWLLESEGLALPTSQFKAARTDGSHGTQRPIRTRPNGIKGPDREEVLAALSPHEKLRIAAGWGLRLGRNPDARRAWVECHAIGREDTIPSAGFDPKTGVYHDFGAAVKLSFFDLAVALGAHRTWLEALNSTGAQALQR